MENSSVIDLFELKVKEYKKNFIKGTKNEISELKKNLKEGNLNQITKIARRKILEDLIRENKKYLQLWIVLNEELSYYYLMYHIGFINEYPFFLGTSRFFRAINPGEDSSPVNVKSEVINDSEIENILRFLEKAVKNGYPSTELVVPEGFFVFDYEFDGGRFKTDEYKGMRGRRLFKAENLEEAFGKLQTAIIFSGERWFQWIKVYFNNKWWKMTPKTGWKRIYERKFQEFIIKEII